MFAAQNLQHIADLPVEFDAVSTGSATSGSGSITATWSHTASGPNRIVIVVIAALQLNQVYTTHTRTVTYGGFPMQSLGGVHYANNDDGWIEFFYLLNPPTGSQTVSATVAYPSKSYPRLQGASLSYKNCRGVGTLEIGYGNEAGTGLSQTITSRTGERIVQAFETYKAFQSGPISNYSQAQRASLPASGGNADDAIIVGDAAGAPSVTFTATRLSDGQSYGEAAIRLLPSFVPFNEIQATASNKLVPNGVSGCYVTMIGGGGGGGTGYGAGFTASGGGGGGGGAAVVQRSFISAASLGSTYSVTVGLGGVSATDGGDTIFTSGSVSVTAGGGKKGANGISGNGNVAAGGSGGTASFSGVSVSTVNGTDGGVGGDPGGTAPPGTRAGQPAIDNTSGGAPGGGGGGARTGGGATARSGAGGSSSYASGGAAQLSADADGNNGVDAGAGLPGGGASGGASGNSGAGGIGGTGGAYGAGGGGGGSGNAVAAGGVGGAGYALIEWV